MTSASFQPASDATQALVAVLQSAEDPNTEVQRQVIQQLQHFESSVPEYPAYMCHIFLSSQEGTNIRLRAGLSLKNAVLSRIAGFQPHVLAYVKETLWKGLGDANPAIRSTTASVLDWLIRTISLSNWPEAVLKLMQFMENDNVAAREAAHKTIANLCRQSPRVTAGLEYNGQKPFDTIIPNLIHHGLTSDSTSIRASTLDALNAFIVVQPPPLVQNVQPFLSNLFALTSDPSLRVRKAVVESMNLLLKFWSEQIIPYIESVIEFMLYCLQSKEEEEDLALVAAEFLLTFTEEPDLYEALHIHLERFLPGLLQAMTFSSSSRQVLDLDEDDAETPDKQSDIKPHIYKSRTTGGTTKIPSLAVRLGMTADDIEAAEEAEGDDVEYADGDEELDDDEEGEDGEWTTRKAAANALETAAETFEGALLEILLPQITKMLSEGDWYQREAAIFALGNVAIGCIESMHEHLPSLVPFLLSSLKDEHPLIRSGAAWTIGEYSLWIANEGQEYLVPAIEGLLTVALDNNKHAQGNAITAFGYLAKEAGPSGNLSPYLPSIAQAFDAAFSKYQFRNVIKLYNTIAYLSDGVGPGGMNDPQVLGTIMPSLVQRWQALGDQDQDLRYLLECLTSLVVAAGAGFKPYAQPVLERAYRIIHTSLYQYQQYQADPSNNEQPDKAFMVVAVDLVAGLVQALGEDAEQAIIPFVQAPEEGTLPMLLVCLSYPLNDVRQSVFALIGDISNHAIKALFPILGQLLQILTDFINPKPRVSTASVDSNCVWCIGELAMSLGSSMESFVPAMVDRMLPVLTSLKASANYTENTAITLGRLALAAPQHLAPILADVVGPWAQTMIHCTPGHEMDTSLQGMCEAAKLNPGALKGNSGQWLLTALAACKNPSPELQAFSKPIIAALGR